MENYKSKLKIILFFLIFLIGVLGLAKISWAASFYYVDNSVAANGSGTQASPWKNLSNINWETISSASKPSTIYISGGATSQTYNESIYIGASGSGLGSEIIIKRPSSAEWSGHSGIVYLRSASDDAITIQTQTWIIIDGLDIRSTASGGKGIFLRDAANYNVIRNCTIQNNYGMSIAGYLSSNITLSRNLIGPNPDGDDPLQFHSDNWIIEYNVFEAGMLPGPHFDDIQIGGGDSSLNTIIRYNIFREALSAVIAVYAHDMGAGENVSLYIYGNIFEFTDNGGVTGNWGPSIALGGTTVWVKAYVYNNIFVNFTYDGMLDGAGSGLGIGGTNAGNLIDVKNNIFYNSQLRMEGSGTKTSDYNIFYMTYDGLMTNWNGNDYTQSQFASYQSASGQDSHSLNTNPLLTSVSATFSPNHDLRPTASSPGNNTGVNFGSSYNVGLSMSNTKSNWPFSVSTVSRPQGSAWDIGAYEYADSAPPDTTPPAAPSGVVVS